MYNCAETHRHYGGHNRLDHHGGGYIDGTVVKKTGGRDEASENGVRKEIERQRRARSDSFDDLSDGETRCDGLEELLLKLFEATFRSADQKSVISHPNRITRLLGIF